MNVLALFFLLFISFANPVSAATIESNVSVTGNSQVEVHTDVTSSSTSSTNSTTHRKTEVTVNGEKTVVESDKPGNDTVEVKNNNGVVTKSVTSNNEEKADTKAEVKKSVAQDLPTPRPTEFEKKVEVHSMFTYIFSSLQDFFKRFF